MIYSSENITKDLQNAEHDLEAHIDKMLQLLIKQNHPTFSKEQLVTLFERLYRETNNGGPSSKLLSFFENLYSSLDEEYKKNLSHDEFGFYPNPLFKPSNELLGYYQQKCKKIQELKRIEEKIQISMRSCPRCGKNIIAEKLVFEEKNDCLYLYNCCYCHYMFRESLHNPKH